MVLMMVVVGVSVQSHDIRADGCERVAHYEIGYGVFVCIEEIIDGDTIVLNEEWILERDGTGRVVAISPDPLSESRGRVQMLGVKSPDRGEVFGEEATHCLAELILHHDDGVVLSVDFLETDSHGVRAVVLRVGSLSTVNEQLVAQGCARRDAQTDVTQALEAAEFAAKHRRVGVWSFDGGAISNPVDAVIPNLADN